MTEIAVIVTAASVLLLANVYAALWRRFRLPTDPSRVVKRVAVTWRQASRHDRVNAALCVVVAVLWWGLL